MSVRQALEELARIKTFFPIQLDSSEIFMRWEDLITQYQVQGKQAHDTRLVAIMLIHQITHLLTFNVSDFKRFPAITAIDPRDVET